MRLSASAFDAVAALTAWRWQHRDATATRRYCFFVPMSLYVTFDLASIRVQFYGAPHAIAQTQLTHVRAGQNLSDEIY